MSGRQNFYKRGVVLYSQFPYNLDSAWAIDKLARKRIRGLSKELSSKNCEVLMAPEIEALVEQRGRVVVDKPNITQELQKLHQFFTGFTQAVMQRCFGTIYLASILILVFGQTNKIFLQKNLT